MIDWLALVCALLLDKVFGELPRWHPLVGFGNLANQLEFRFNQKNFRRTRGCFAWSLLVLPLPLLIATSYYLINDPLIIFMFDVLILYFAIGLNSLRQHALQVFRPLVANDLSAARHYTGYMVSRKTDAMEPKNMSRAVIESVLENGHDAVIASLFWYMMGGAPWVILHRLANTLDAMWGYKSERFLHFGWCSAKMDDWLGWPSAKLSAFCYALQGHCLKVLKLAYHQASGYKSINGGWTIASGAYALKLKLGGQAQYDNQTVDSPILGQGNLPEPEDILRSVHLVERSVIIFSGIALVLKILLINLL